MRKVLALTLIAALTASCGSVLKTAQKTTHDAIKHSEQLHDAHVLSDAEFKAANKAFYRIAVSEKALTTLWAAGAAKPTDVAAFIAVVDAEAAALRAAFPQDHVAQVLGDIQKVIAWARGLKL